MLSKNSSEIITYLEDFGSQTKNFKMEILKLCWFMRGGVTYQEALHMSPEERESVVKLVTENMEIAKKSGRDFF